jgi:hypothetical protein
MARLMILELQPDDLQSGMLRRRRDRRICFVSVYPDTE